MSRSSILWPVVLKIVSKVLAIGIRFFFVAHSRGLLSSRQVVDAAAKSKPIQIGKNFNFQSCEIIQFGLENKFKIVDHEVVSPPHPSLQSTFDVSRAQPKTPSLSAKPPQPALPPNTHRNHPHQTPHPQIQPQTPTRNHNRLQASQRFNPRFSVSDITRNRFADHGVLCFQIHRNPSTV